MHAPPATLAAVRAILIARNVFGHILEQPAGHHWGVLLAQVRPLAAASLAYRPREHWCQPALLH